MSDSTTDHAITADLGPNVAALTCQIDGRPVAVINTATAHNPTMRTQAAAALLYAGMDAGLILGALHGVRR
jgi:hypothetical protein